ncbi:YcjF family protein [Ruegeria marina]|uniref:Putative membrane protein n=1 Tax=Ruegeria marina TaxID=639004 RepID=A0A1G6TH36_9RHOB|nr:TIGR01620 family protein [Ruegeria marina]SDD28383.1 putative membrane protein [Ruegeria marina]
MTQGPVLIDLGDETTPPPPVTEAPAVPDLDRPQGTAMQAAARVAARRPSRLARWFWGLALSLLGAMVSLTAWSWVNDLIARVPVLGWAMAALLAVFVLVCGLIALRELAAIGRLGRIDGLRRAADAALAEDNLAQARAVCARLDGFYRGREDLAWGRARLTERAGEQFDAATLLALAEETLLAPLDAVAQREVEAAARRVATVTALVPMALADVATALASSLRMIRRVAEIYGGRAGVLGSWRLTRAVLSHLVATGAVAVGDDLLEPVLGGSVLSKLSRRFGEGLVNGALTARVGVAAMEVCRPLPFSGGRRPSVRKVVRRALTGLMSKSG